MEMSKVHKMVSKDMADLRKIETIPIVESVNILGSKWWDILWQTYFLMRKKLYFETTTYAGRMASNLDGEWDLIQRTEEPFNQLTIPKEIIPVNSSYVLKRVSRLPADAYKAELLSSGSSFTMKKHQAVIIPVKVKNNSKHVWPAESHSVRRIALSYHWLDKDGKVIIFDGIRTSLPYDVKPGEEVTLNASVKTPDKPGEYILEFDMVQERVSWFKDKGSKTLKIDMKVD
jgi:hypothetical protein